MKCEDLIIITLFCGLLIMFLIMQPHTKEIVYTISFENKCLISIYDFKDYSSDFNMPIIQEKQKIIIENCICFEQTKLCKQGQECIIKCVKCPEEEKE